MSCPPDPLLLLHDAGELPHEIAEGWTGAALRDHVAGCRRCRRALDGWRRSIESFRAVDVVDATPYDDAFFDELAREVDAALGREPAVVPLRPARRLPPLAWAAAALLVVSVGLGQLADRAAEPVAMAEPAVDAPPIDALQEEARALGRAWLDEALETADAGTEQVAWLDPDAPTDEERYAFGGTLFDDLDELSRAELAALFTRM
jgi:hypothetical protein